VFFLLRKDDFLHRKPYIRAFTHWKVMPNNLVQLSITLFILNHQYTLRPIILFVNMDVSRHI
jgi:hypothetical protein